jgi:DNA replication initiation complex subunit (GINS family)
VSEIDRELLKDMAAYIRDLCQRHDRYLASGKPSTPRAEAEYERGIALLERVNSREE